MNNNLNTNPRSRSLRLLSLALLGASLWLAPSLHATPLAYSGGTATAALSAGQWAYYEVTVPPGNAGWRLTLNATGSGNPDLYLQRGTNQPTTGSYLKASTGEATDTITLTDAESTPTNYVVGVYLPSGGPVNFTLTSEDHYLTTLPWDPGTADAGTATFTNASATGGEYFFQLVTENADLAIWRTALRVTSGEANLYLLQNSLPTTASYNYKSDRTGSDGVVRPLSSTSGAGQTWYLLVKATAGAQWSLLSGDIFVTDLGALATNAASGSGLSTIPPEGLRYFKTTIPTETLAWRLWLQNAAGSATWNTNFYVRKSLAPHPEAYEQNRTGQALLVPSYLVAGGGDLYYLAVPGNPGDTFQLDSRQQAVTDLAFASTNSSLTVTGFLYRTYRVPVPVEQKAWEVDVAPLSGNPDFALRRSLVPNEFNNDAFSEVPGSVTDSVTLVPQGLSDGMYYLTVYAGAAASFNLVTKEPASYIIPFESNTPNPEPARNGWVYFQLLDIPGQLGKLGWFLALTNHVPGSEIAIRRNTMPGRWNYRQNGSLGSSGYSDKTTTQGWLLDPNHPADIWYVGIYTPQAALGNFTLHSGDIVPQQIAFEGLNLNLTNLGPNEWQFYRIDVPATNNGAAVLGWELRVKDWVGAQPVMVVCRGSLPNGAGTTSFGNVWTYANSFSWPIGYQIATSSGDGDWTQRSDADGGQASYLMSLAMGNPLEPGTYYIGFYNSSASMTMTNCTFTSKAVGDGMSYAPQPISFAGGDGLITNLPARGVMYFSVDVPSNQPTWKLRLENTVGDSMLLVRKDRIPTFGYWWGGPGASAANSIAWLDRLGDEYDIQAPAYTETMLQAGRYYLMVVSEGQNPTTSQNGTNSSSAVLHSLGNAPVTDLGTLPLAGAVEQADAYAGGENKLYTFTVPTNVLALEIRLLNRVGSPKMALRADTLWSSMVVGCCNPIYGMSAANSASYSDPALITIANPTPGTYSLRIAEPSASPSQGSYTIRLRAMGSTDLNLSEVQNTNGLSHTATDFLADNQRAFYKIQVPSDLNGAPILGWYPTLNIISGGAQFRVRKDNIPTDANNPTPWVSTRMVLVPPFLTPGTWYVEVKGVGAAEFIFTSEVVTLDRVWAMPAVGAPVTTPGLTAPFFGDTGVATNGIPLTGDQGTDLGSGLYHYYAVDVPTNNAGLFRTELQAISGNPNLYLRRLNLPTVEPYSTYDCALASGANTEYGNWVPTDGRTQKELTPGRWYLAVKAESGSNCRYRLKLSTGSVQDLALNGGSFNNQVLAAGDWRYYRVQIPWNAPVNWNFTYSQSQGDVDLYLRDTVPPGDWSSPGSIYHWANDYKNTSPYPSYGNAGTYTVQAPQLRPGHIYYLGFRANSDATFNVSSAISGGTLGDFPVLSCYGGTATTNLPGNSAVTFRIPVPADAVRWQHFTTNAGTVQVYLAQGSLPSPGYNNWSGTSGNGSLSQLLSGWPWVAGESYFLTATNTGGSAQPFTLVLDARTAATDDSDNDGLPDAWEMLYFGNTSYTGTSDPDGDGNSNLVEFTDGTNPNNGYSAKYFLSVTATNGVVTRSLTLPKYDKGTNVLLTAVADPGAVFTRWSGSLSSTNNPLSVTLTNNTYLTAHFTMEMRIAGLWATFTNGAVPLRVTGVAGKGGIVIEASTNLVHWVPIYTNFPTGNVFDFTDPASPNLPARFYRAKASGNLLMESFNTDTASTAQTLATYPAFSFTGSPADVRVLGGVLTFVNPPSWSSFTFGIAGLPGDFTIAAGVGSVGSTGNASVGLSFGDTGFVFFPGFPGGAFRDGRYGGNQDMGFTPAENALHHMTIKVTPATGRFDVTVRDGSNPANVFTHTFTNPSYVPGSPIYLAPTAYSGPASFFFDNLVVTQP